MFKQQSWITVLTVITLTSLVLSACGGPTTLPPTVAPTAAKPEPAASATPAEGPITVTDAMGRAVKFDRLPQRIVLAGKAFFMIADAVYLFPEAQQRVVALLATSQSKRDFMPVVDANLSGKTLLTGADVGAEQIAPTKPDVVILKSVANKLGNSLEQIGIPVIYVDFETPAQYSRDLAILGQVLGNPARAQKLAAYYQAQIDRVAGKTKGLKDTDKPKVLLLQYAEKSGTVAFSIAPADWIQTQLVEMAGANPVWKATAEKGGWTVVNLEQIAAWNPDQIFIINYSGDSKEVVKKLKADPKWQALRAVKDGKIYGFASDFYSWDQPDTRWGLGLLWLASKIQPPLFADVDIQREMSQFYQDGYGLDQGVIQEKVVPVLQGDVL